MPRIRRLIPLERLILVGTILQSVSAVGVAWAPSIYLAVPAMLLSGGAWIAVANSMTLATQMALPDWVRARGMSIYQMALMGSTALGAATWGQIATVTDIHTSVGLASVSSVVALLVAQRLVPDRGIEDDLTPSSAFKAPVAQATPAAGRVQVLIEYRIDPARSAEFEATMQDSRRSRMRQGALAWELLHDLYDPGRYIEQITDESWTEHLRRFDRVTTADVALRDRKLAFHLGETPPVVSRFLLRD